MAHSARSFETMIYTCTKCFGEGRPSVQCCKMLVITSHLDTNCHLVEK